jgi:hypothetical protein
MGSAAKAKLLQPNINGSSRRRDRRVTTEFMADILASAAQIMGFGMGKRADPGHR